MNYTSIFHANKRQFDNTMKKEAITVTDFFDNDKSYQVFFRRNNRGTVPQGKLRLFYQQDTDISIGTIFILKDTSWLVVSQDGIESDVYYTSLAIRCDTSFTVYSEEESRYVVVPCAVISDKLTISNNATINVISGNVTIYTQDNAYARCMAINNTYYNFGGYYRVKNVFYNNNLAYVAMQREAKPSDVRSLTYDGLTSLDMADNSTYQLSYVAVKNNEPVSNPTMTYASSDDTIATVDANGLLTMLQSGIVTITATWTDDTVATSCNTEITIANNGTVTTIGQVTITTTGSSQKAGGSAKTYTATFTDNNNNDVTANYTCVWSITNCSFDVSEITMTNTSDSNRIRIKVSNPDLVGGTFTLNAVDDGGLYTPATYDITLESTV